MKNIYNKSDMYVGAIVRDCKIIEKTDNSYKLQCLYCNKEMNLTYNEIRRRQIDFCKCHNEFANNRNGEIWVNSNNETLKIIDYKNAHNVLIEFQDDYKERIWTSYGNIKKGCVKNPRELIKYGGYHGISHTTVANGHKKCFSTWNKMLQRANDVSYQTKHPTYVSCKVCDDWYCYANFEKWYDENYYELGEELMNLDKDILIKGNKLYSPSTCIFVSQRINKLFTKSDSRRGEFPLGVKQSGHKYSSQISFEGKKLFLGTYDSIESAFQAYKTTKENFIKQVADEYKSKYPNFPIKLYDAMYNYQVEITD